MDWRGYGGSAYLQPIKNSILVSDASENYQNQSLLNSFTDKEIHRMSDETDGLHLNSQVQRLWVSQIPQNNNEVRAGPSGEMAAKRSGKQARGGLSGLRSSGLALLFLTFSLLISVTDANAVKISQGLIDLNKQTLVGEVHNITLTLNRDMNTKPIVEWQNDQCFKLQFDSPYTQSNLWFPFNPENPPKCSLGKIFTDKIDGIDCRIGATNSILLLNFQGFVWTNFTSITLDFSNFENPWSAGEVPSVRISSYTSTDCTGSVESSKTMKALNFDALEIPEAAVKITSSSNVLGDSDPATKVTFKITPPLTTSKDGRGMFQIIFPKWYNVGNKRNMMYNVRSRNECESEDMRITASTPSSPNSDLQITYDNMKPEKISGAEITIVCKGFRNPIYNDFWDGFFIIIWDSEIEQRPISQSDSLAFDANGMIPALISLNGLTIAPTVFKIGTFSTWLFTLTDFPIPLETSCFIRLYIPDDLAFDNKLIKGEQMMSPQNGEIIPNIEIKKDADGGTTLEFEACFSEREVGPSPGGRIVITAIQTPIARRDTKEFRFEVFKNFDFTSPIARLGEGIVIKAQDLAPGLNKVVSIVPEDIGVQIVTNYMIKFETEHTLYAPAGISIEFPPLVILPPGGTVVNIRPQTPSKKYIVAQTGTVLPGNIIKMDNIYGGQENRPLGSLVIELLIEGIQNPYSSQPAGDFTVLTFYENDMVDSGTSNGSFTAVSGSITGVPILVQNPITSGTTSVYTLTFTTQSSIPKNGYIHINMPDRLVIRQSEVKSEGSCTSATLTCTFVDPVEGLIIIRTQEIIAADTPTQIVLHGITNPRSVQPTEVIHIVTFDADGISEIDSGFDIGTTMIDLAKITGFSVRPTSTINGELNTYMFTVSTIVSFEKGDVLQYTMPANVGLPETAKKLNIRPLPRIVDGEKVKDELRVEISGQTIIITFIQVAATTQTYGWSLDNIKNPPSTKVSSPIIDIITKNKSDWNIQEYSYLAVGAQPPSIENKQPAIIIESSLLQQSDSPATPTTYQIKFVPINPIPSQGSIQISWPEIVQVPDTTKCTVNVGKNIAGNCIIDQVKSTITITDVFSEQTSYFSEVIITLDGVINPTDNKQKGSGFILMTYDSGTLTNRIDKIPSTGLVPTLKCDYPCRDCLASDRKNCLSCWTQDFSTKRYFVDTDIQGTCEASCPYGFSRDNSDSYVCIACDISCESCKDENKSDCMVCATNFPYKVSGTSHCLETCNRGYFQTTTSFTCATCEEPCADCEGDSKVCTACDTKSEFPVLFQQNCIKECAPGYTNVNDECQKCDSPCGTCEGATNKCVSCDGTEDRRFLYASQCYSECPTNSSPFSEDETNLICIGCTDPACELCDAKEPGICKRCSVGLYVNDGLCVSGCPDEWKTNDDGTACVLFTINDIGIIPFPFLIMAFLGCLIATFGKCKKKLVGRNNKYISTQNTITCFIVIIAGVQFLAIIALIIWALLFGTMFLFYAACGLLGLLILLNIIFQICYTCIFNRSKTPPEKLRKYKEGKINKELLKRFVKPKDELFHAYVKKHGSVSCLIAIFTFVCTFKCNKMYYSHFYSFSMFKARWSTGDHKYYRKFMTIFCIVAMVIDAMLICLCIASLMTMNVMSNMLWVTTVEVAALSLLLIIVGCVELFKMKQYLQYNEPKKSGLQRQKFDVSSANDFLDKDSREVMMKNLLRNVKTNQDMFLNNKLDDLLNLFGDRRCKSMIEFGTGWDKEDDPRRVITWPLSPNTIKEYDGEYKFTREDMIGGFEDNVYAEAKVKPTIYEVAVQGDQGEQDFMRQMHRKQGDMLTGQMDDDDELKNRKAKGKRRGRKNKYYTAIDAEDDEEADGQEPSIEEDDDQQDNLAIIKEQEEEEEALRLKVEEERRKQEQAQAERRAKLAEAERLRLEAENAEEDSRRQAADEEERLREIQEGEELLRMRELEATRARLGREEEEARLKVEADEVNRKKELAAMNEANRAKYEAEDAVRRKALEEEQARLQIEKEEHEAKIASQLAEMNKRKLEESERMQAQRDEEELRLRKQQLEREEQIRQEEKEAERLRLEQEAAERRMLAANTAEEKRAARNEEERLQREADELDRQRKLAQEEHVRQEAIRLEEEQRQKRNQEEDARRRKIEEEERLHKERLNMDEDARRISLQQEETERMERMRREEERSKLRLDQEEAEHKSRLQGEEHERLTALQQKETERLEHLRQEETLRLERLQLEEEHRLGSLKQEESSRRMVLEQEEEARLRRIEIEDDARKRQEQADNKRKTAEEAIRARDEEDRILKEREKIESQKAALAAAKVKQEAELAANAKKEEERKLREARETEERIERERLEREAMEKEKAELARKQKEAEAKLLGEKDDLARAKLLKEAEELENQEKLRKEREAFEQEKRLKAAEMEAAKQDAERERFEAEARRIEQGTQMSKMKMASEIAISEKKLAQEDDALEAEIVKSHYSEKKLEQEEEALEAEVQQDEALEAEMQQEDDALEAEIVMSQELIQDFQKPKHPVEMPPNADSRTFNVNDILGELDRDDRGNIVVLQDSQGNNCDKTGHMTNIRGYLQDPVSLDILENHTKEKMFDAEELDDKGELPAPFCVEKFNFNPHNLMGDLEFQYDQNTGRAIPQLLQTKQGFYVDKKGRRVNRYGWLVQGGNGHIVDKLGRKKFDRKQLDDGDMQKLLNYNGKRYDIKDVIGVFDKDGNGSIILQRGNNGSFTDNVGRNVNEKGYLIDSDGNIIDREGKHIFSAKHLKNGEFPKIFLFTKFNIDNIMGDFEMSPLSEPILDQDKNGNFIDRKGRLVNSRGYLINAQGDVIDKRGKRMFDKVVLTPEGEIPKIFRMQILKTDSGSSLSRLMDEIEKNQPSEYERVEEEKEEDEGDDQGQGDDHGDTSVDSAMEDTPANYNMANQRFDEYEDYEAIPEETEHKNSRMANRRRPPQAQVEVAMEMPKKKTKKKMKKKKKTGYLEYLMPTGREVNMADAYGGQAKGQFRRNGVKYDKERLMNRIKTPANIPGGRAQLEALAATVAGFHKPNQSKMVTDEDMDQRSARGPSSRPPRVKRNQFIDGDSQDGGNSQMGAKQRHNTSKQGRDSRTNLNELRTRKINTQQKRGDAAEGDFEKMFGKDVDQYLEGSEFDLDEYDKLSQFSRGTGRNSQANMKLKAMEQVYLQRIEAEAVTKKASQRTGSHPSATTATAFASKKQKSPKKPPAFREFQDRFEDQPDYVHRGQVLEFETQKQGRTEKRQPGPSPPRDGAAGASNFEKQQRQRQ